MTSQPCQADLNEQHSVTQPFKSKLYDAAQTKLQWFLYAGSAYIQKQPFNPFGLSSVCANWDFVGGFFWMCSQVL